MTTSAPSTPQQAKQDYDKAAPAYSNYASTPSGQLEGELIELALRDCCIPGSTTVLDLGGGNGLYARKALQLGAVLVDVVDISPGMLEAGRNIDGSDDGTYTPDMENRLRFFEADATKSLNHLPLLLLLQDKYDVVMANWIFSFVGTSQELEGVFGNVKRYLKPGGRFIGVRDADPWSPVLRTGKYGGLCRDVRRVPGGVEYVCELQCNTPAAPVVFKGRCLETIYSGSAAAYEEFGGLTDVEIVPYGSAPVVQGDPDFWDEFLKRPCLAVVKALRVVAATEL
ncbi:Ubiquinone/menaquinone biosynthesis C-methyltransferase [Cladorrhinum sp. PSN259]|nr:Ubiquinone/menaquinone biosynthesis C-methyltransferase [Cladorrhinum sp. PSN259]